MNASFGWSYPPGVTGRELQIAGPDEEWDEHQTCEDCEFDGTAEMWTYGGVEHWTCPQCGSDYQEDIDDGPDPDQQRDLQIENAWIDAHGL